MAGAGVLTLDGLCPAGAHDRSPDAYVRIENIVPHSESTMPGRFKVQAKALDDVVNPWLAAVRRKRGDVADGAPKRSSATQGLAADHPLLRL